MRTHRSRRSRRIGVLVPAVAVALVLGAGCGDDESTSTTTAKRTTTTAASTSTTEPSTTSAPSNEQPTTAVWPFAGTGRRFDDPVAAARSFAVDYVGFTDPVVGELRRGDNRSGEVEVRPKANGPATTVFVRQVTSDDSWWVLGCATPNLRLTSPSTGAVVSSPVAVSGTSTAFEATVNVTVRQDGSTDPIGTGIVMGGSMGELGPFSGPISFSPPAAAGGSIALTTSSPEDGRIWEASVGRFLFR